MYQNELLETNLMLREELSILEKEYGKLIQLLVEIKHLPDQIYGNYKIMDLMLTEQIKAQRGEKSTQTKMETVEDFAVILQMMVDINIKSLEEKYKCKW